MYVCVKCTRRWFQGLQRSGSLVDRPSAKWGRRGGGAGNPPLSPHPLLGFLTAFFFESRLSRKRSPCVCSMARGYFGHQGPYYIRFFTIGALYFGFAGRVGLEHKVPTVSCL